MPDEYNYSVFQQCKSALTTNAVAIILLRYKEAVETFNDGIIFLYDFLFDSH